MPELPDVESFRLIFENSSLNKKVEEVEVKDSYIVKEINSEELKDRLNNESFECTTRRGKYFFAQNTNRDWLVVHFGMTGRFTYVEDSSKDSPEHTRLIIYFADSFLAFVCTRKLGKVTVVDSKDSFIKDKDLGPDALSVDWDTFYQKVKDRKAMIKSVLMNQSIIAGIGNIYADEVCFQSRIHPRTKTTEFNKKN